MASIPTSVRLTKDTEQAVRLYIETAANLLSNQFSIRSHLEGIDRYYMREGNFDTEQRRARHANARGDKKKIQDVTVPIVMPQVEAALGFLSNIFITGYPVFGVSAPPEMADAALQLETIIAENSVTAGWLRQLIMFMRDGLKYNLHGLEVTWQQKSVAAVETDLNSPNSAKPKQVIWHGNVLRRMDLYNTIFDPRVHPAEIHSKGEFAGYVEIMSRVQMKQFFNDMYNQIPVPVVMRALESSLGSIGGGTSRAGLGYFVPLLNPSPLIDSRTQTTFDWMAWATAARSSKSIQYSNIYEVATMYARIIPSDFNLKVPAENTPQVWKFILVNGQVVVWAERLTNAHNYIPIFFGQPMEDGLDFQTKSFASNVSDMQDISSALWAGYMASKRRLVGDRALYDPLRIREADINSDSPTAKIPVRPGAYGKPIAEAVYQFPFRDEQTNSLVQGSEMVVKFANLINGQNPAQQGQFVKGNKTRHEFESIMGSSNTHNTLMALMSETQVFTPVKEVIKINILQFQGETTIFNADQKKQVKIDPVELRKAATQFKMADGLFPTDKLMSSDELGAALQVIAQSPQLQAEYNIGPAFSYLMKMRGVDLRPFEKPEEQKLYEQQLAAWQQSATLAAEKGTAFSTPMPQPPASATQPQQATPSAQGVALASTTGT